MAMINLREYKKQPDRLHDIMQWAMLVAPGVVLNKNGSFMTTLAYRGPDLDSATKGELVSYISRLNNTWRRMGGGWAIFSEADHFVSTEYPQSDFDNPVPELVDQERRAGFAGETYYESDYYITLVYMPPPDFEKHAANWFFERTEAATPIASDMLKYFVTETDRILSRLQGVFKFIRKLSDDELCTYFHNCISSVRHPVAAPDPEMPAWLDTYLADKPVLPGIEPKIGDMFIGALTFTGFPRTSTPGMLDMLNSLAIPYRWVTRFIFLDKDQAESGLADIKRRWFAKRKSIVTMLKETIFNSQSIMEDPDALRKATDADAALAAVADGAVGWGFFTQTIIVTDPDIEALKRKLKALESALHHAKFVVINELERNNALEAWLGTIPGHCLQNIRKPQVHTLTLAHLFPASAVWSGSPYAGHLTKYYRRKGLNRDAPPLFQAVTNGAIPYRHDPHVLDVGHEFDIGPTGSGKSTKLNFDRLSWLRYVDAQVYSFDFKAASFALTLGVGGDFYDLGDRDTALAFQPLAGIREDAERAWSAQWIEGLLTAEGLKVDMDHRADTWDTLSRMASGTPDRQLTMSTFMTRAQHPDVKKAIKRYTVAGQLGYLFDSSHDSLRYGRWQSFEMEKLMNTEAAVAPTLTYLFHRLESRFNMGVPTLLVLDEAWSYLDDPMFAAQLGAWLLLLRSKNVKVVFATQSLAHVADSPIVSTIKESCPNRTWLANPRALDPAINALYRSFGLNERQIDIIHKMEQKREYYYTSEVGNRKYELGLGPLALTYTTLNDQSDRVFLGELMQQAHGDTQEFNRLLLQHRKLDWAVPMLDDLFAKHRGHAALQAA